LGRNSKAKRTDSDEFLQEEQVNLLQSLTPSLSSPCLLHIVELAEAAGIRRSSILGHTHAGSG
jgi:hypothetical protein